MQIKNSNTPDAMNQIKTNLILLSKSQVMGYTLNIRGVMKMRKKFILLLTINSV